MAFTDFGIENLIELVRLYKKDPGLPRRRPPAAYAGWIRWAGLRWDVKIGPAGSGTRGACQKYASS